MEQFTYVPCRKLTPTTFCTCPQARKADYAALTRQYYNLATDFYEYGWAQSFHFCRFVTPRETLAAALARHEYALAHLVGIRKADRVLDVGCGVGGPARAIARFTDAQVTGITINAYQAQRATRYAAAEGILAASDESESDSPDKPDDVGGRCRFVVGDFMDLPFDEGSFDAAYAIEATVHAPSLEAAYTQVYRVLKPGGVFGVYEWVLTDKYDHDNLRHRQIRRAIEQGDGIAHLVTANDALCAMRAAGFEVLEAEDLAGRYVGDDGVVPGSDPAPWYWPLDATAWRYASTVGDLLGTFRMSPWGRWFAHGLMAALETLRLAPPGTKKTGDSLAQAAGALVAGGKEGLFTPMFLMVARKPLTGEKKSS